MAFLLQIFNELDRTTFTVFFRLEGRVRTGVFQHRQVVQWDVWTAPRIGSRRQVIGVGFTRHFEHCHSDFFSHFRTAGEPFCIGPALHHFFGFGIARFGFFCHVVEVIKHQQCFLQTSRSNIRHFGVIQQLDQGVYVVATHHSAQQFSRFGFADQVYLDITMGYSGQKASFHFSRIVHTRRHTVCQQVHQKLCFTRRRVFDQLDQLSSLLGI